MKPARTLAAILLAFSIFDFRSSITAAPAPDAEEPIATSAPPFAHAEPADAPPENPETPRQRRQRILREADADPARRQRRTQATTLYRDGKTQATQHPNAYRVWRRTNEPALFAAALPELDAIAADPDLHDRGPAIAAQLARQYIASRNRGANPNIKNEDAPAAQVPGLDDAAIAKTWTPDLWITHYATAAECAATPVTRENIPAFSEAARRLADDTVRLAAYERGLAKAIIGQGYNAWFARRVLDTAAISLPEARSLIDREILALTALGSKHNTVLNRITDLQKLREAIK